MFLYRFVRRRRRRPQILVHAITFEQLFGFISLLARLLVLTYRLHDQILGYFRRDFDLEFSRSNMEFAISQSKMVRLPRNEKQTYRLNSRPHTNVTNGFDLGHDIDLWIFKVKCDLDLWPHTWLWPRIFMVKFWNSCISQWEGQLTLNKGGWSRSFMTMTATIWWPRSGVRIYQIVTRVISDVGVPSTHLVYTTLVWAFILCLAE